MSTSNVFNILAKKLNSPLKIQKFLCTFKYNKKPTMRSAMSTWKSREAHCLEATFLAAAIMEKLGYPPLVISFESIDLLEHVIFIYKKNGKWGALGFSRDQGLKGRKPVFSSVRSLAMSYYDPYIDKTGLITAYQLAHLDDTKSNWRISKKNVWKAEKYLLDLTHIAVPSTKSKVTKMRKRYEKYGPMKSKSSWLY